MCQRTTIEFYCPCADQSNHPIKQAHVLMQSIDSVAFAWCEAWLHTPGFELDHRGRPKCPAGPVDMVTDVYAASSRCDECRKMGCEPLAAWKTSMYGAWTSKEIAEQKAAKHKQAVDMMMAKFRRGDVESAPPSSRPPRSFAVGSASKVDSGKPLFQLDFGLILKPEQMFAFDETDMGSGAQARQEDDVSEERGRRRTITRDFGADQRRGSRSLSTDTVVRVPRRSSSTETIRRRSDAVEEMLAQRESTGTTKSEWTFGEWTFEDEDKDNDEEDGDEDEENEEAEDDDEEDILMSLIATPETDSDHAQDIEILFED
ncbi:hypothetical protein B0T17DRAFT_615075 [Bombardia bombarda]|uniref:Uncharacterized protein n=1 Tax=Bombardia bombarda TaxID=252184 RepID=A0AA39X8S8_9PEZI|nr:hypothetical protein B0T17DRAFT_615075 [Bombardia bombarda]